MSDIQCILEIILIEYHGDVKYVREGIFGYGVGLQWD